MLQKFNEFDLITSAVDRLKKTIPQVLLKVAVAFKDSDKSIYIVGGAVRDALLGHTPHDFDLSTDAKPVEMQAIFDKLKIKYSLKDVKYGIVIVHLEGQTFEICTFRRDLTSSRDTEVELVSRLEDDSARRDLTYNAIYYDILSEKIIDPEGGIKDIIKNKTRMVGDAKARLEEDSIRTLRAIRFCLRYEHTLSKSLKTAIMSTELDNYDPLLDIRKPISRERIWDEFVKAWEQTKFGEYLLTITELDLWKKIFPSVVKINKEFLLKNRNKDLNLSCWFAGLLFDMKVEAGKYMMDIKSTSNIAGEVQLLVDLAIRWNELTPIEWKKMWGRKNIPHKFIIKWNELVGISPVIPQLVEWKMRVGPTDFPELTGKELGIAILREENKRFKEWIQ